MMGTERPRRDRFERMVIRKYNLPPELHDQSKVSNAYELLKAEHAWMVRMVKQQAKDVGIKQGWWDGYKAACDDILTRLTQRR